MKDITISTAAGMAAMRALQQSIVQRARRDSLDGAPTTRGRCTVTSRDHTAHSEIARRWASPPALPSVAIATQPRMTSAKRPIWLAC